MSVMTALRPKEKVEPKVTGRLLWGWMPRIEWDKDDPVSVRRAELEFYGGLNAGMSARMSVCPSRLGTLASECSSPWLSASAQWLPWVAL